MVRNLINMKHVLALTYEPKINDVRNGKCTQTIRPYSQRPRKINDLIMFHGWSGKPYNSKWNWRTKYFRIDEVFAIQIFEDSVLTEPMITNRGMLPNEMEDLAKRDGFESYNEMYTQFKKMYGNRLSSMVFQVIRWNIKL